jgi:hypothetical protein
MDVVVDGNASVEFVIGSSVGIGEEISSTDEILLFV